MESHLSSLVGSSFLKIKYNYSHKNTDYMIFLILFFPTLLLVVSFPLWLIKKLSNEGIEYIIYALYGIYGLILSFALDTGHLIYSILFLILVSLLNALPLKLYLKLLNSRGSKDFVSPAEAEGMGCEKSDEDKLIGLLRDLHGSNYISLSDKLYDRSLSVPYDEFRDAIYKEFRVSISHQYIVKNLKTI